MAVLTLYLTDTPTVAPYPTTSQLLTDITAPPAGPEVQLGPGLFNNGVPGNTLAGQWYPSTPQADGNDAIELSEPGPSIDFNGSTTQGWLSDTASNLGLTGAVLAAGVWTVQLRLRANVGAAKLGRLMLRVRVVNTRTQGGADAYTVSNLFATSIAGEVSHSSGLGQDGWRSQVEARIGPGAAAGNFVVTFAGAAESVQHRFSADERLYLEFGFGDADDAVDRVWRLDYNQASSFVTSPALQSGSANPYHVQSGPPSATTTGTLGLQCPDAVLGDKYFAFIYGNNNALIDTPADWTKFLQFDNTAAMRVTIFERDVPGGAGPLQNFTMPNDGTLKFGYVACWRAPGGFAVGIEPTAPTTSANGVADTVTYADFNPAGPCTVVAAGFYGNDNTTIDSGLAVAGSNPVLATVVDVETATGGDGSLFLFYGDSDGAATGARSHATNAVADAISVGVMFGLVAVAGPMPNTNTKRGRAPYLSQRWRGNRQRWN